MNASLQTKILSAAFAISCFFVSACENDMGEVDALIKERSAIEEAFNVTSYMSQQGAMKAKLTAPYMIIQQTDSSFVEFPRSLHVDFFDDSTVIESTLDARYAKYRESERKVFLRDSVVVINIKNRDTLRTDELWWDQNQEQFYTDKAVQIHQPDKTIYGTGLKAGQDFTWYDIFNITGEVLTDGNALE